MWNFNHSKTKTALGGRFVILGSGNWTRTSDIRINSPFLFCLTDFNLIKYSLIFCGVWFNVDLTKFNENW